MSCWISKAVRILKSESNAIGCGHKVVREADETSKHRGEEKLQYGADLVRHVITHEQHMQSLWTDHAYHLVGERG